MKIILASKSERRSKILNELGIKHKVIVSSVKEDNTNHDNPKETVLAHAIQKAEDIFSKNKDSVVIGADTIVVCHGKIYGKPVSMKEAEEFICKFMGKTIDIYTGLAVLYKNKQETGVDISKIHVKVLNIDTVREFLSSINPLDRAGGFSMEGPMSIMFDNIEGSFFNILGMPVSLLYDLFQKMNIPIL